MEEMGEKVLSSLLEAFCLQPDSFVGIKPNRIQQSAINSRTSRSANPSARFQ